jgi:prepilin-type N-terminal cleavage/methylation domain-containing protein
MSAADARERGFTFAEVLIAMSLMLIVTAATLAVFTTMERKTRDNQRISDQERMARVATDLLAKRLRNLASPAGSGPAPQALERAEPTDLMFRTVDSTPANVAANPENLQRYRYCLSADGKLWAARQPSTTWTVTPPATSGCGPSDGFPGNHTVVAEHVVNGPKQPVFKYQVSPVPGAYSEQSTVAQSDFPNDIAIRSELFIDPDVANPPGATTITSRVFLRNQNRPPSARLTATYSTSDVVTINASDSLDPENNPLYFRFLDGTTVVQEWSQQATFTFRATAVGTHTFTVVVRDIGGLQTTSNSITVTCSSTPISCTGPTS